jgi:hypothetical protein
MNIIKPLFCVVVSLLVYSSTATATSESSWINKIMVGDETEIISENINERHIKEADNFIQNGTTNPIVWYLRGGFTWAKIGFYHRYLIKMKEYYSPSLPKIQKLILSYQAYYQKALALDDNPNAPAHLTGLMLSDIGSDVLGDPAIKVRALEKAAALARAGNDATGSEMLE